MKEESLLLLSDLQKLINQVVLIDYIIIILGEINMKGTSCEYCANYTYDEECDEYYCDVNLDEDEYYRFVSSDYKECPYYRSGDEYKVVRHQM